MQVSGGGGTAFALEPRVNFANRKRRDTVWAGLFIGALITWVVLGVIFKTKSRSLDAISAEITKCEDDHRRLFGATNLKTVAANGLFDLAIRYKGVIGYALSLPFIIGLIWLILLQKFARIIVWAQLIINALAPVVMGIYIVAQPGVFVPYQGYPMIVSGAAMLLALWWFQKSIELAAALITQATRALQAMPGMLGISFLLQAAYLSVLVGHIFFLISAFTAGDILYSPPVEGAAATCYLQIPHAMIYALCGTFLWITGFFSTLRCYMLAGSGATWYFHPPCTPADQVDVNRPRFPSLSALGWGLSSSLGSVSVAAFIIALIDHIQRMANTKRSASNVCYRCLCFPFAFLTCIAGICLSCFKFITKFTVIIMAISGRDFMDSAKTSYNTMSHHFVNGYVNNVIAQRVLYFGAMVISLGIAFLSWVYVADKDNVSPYPTDTALVIRILVYIFSFVVVYEPLLGLFVLSIFPHIVGDTVGYPCAFGVMMGCVSHLLLGSTARVVLDIMDAFFVCFAIDRDHGIMSPVGRDIHEACVGTDTYQNKDQPSGIWQAAPMTPHVIAVHHVAAAATPAAPIYGGGRPSAVGYQPVQPYAPYTPASPPHHHGYVPPPPAGHHHPQPYGHNPHGGYIAPSAVPMSGGYAPLPKQ